MGVKSAEQEAYEQSSGYVYFIAAGEPPAAIKIGVTKADSFAKRLSTHQGSNHEPLRVLGVIESTSGERPMAEAMRLEGELHSRFAHLQRFEKGWVGSEWFSAAPVLMTYIDENTTPPGELGLPESVARPGPGLNDTT